jgi:ppGpp synthetase/RelA/SpoT-type nucleotidyltranferase
MTDPKDIVKHVLDNQYVHKIFLNNVESVFREEPGLKTQPPAIHSLKTRVKEPSHIEEKIVRKQQSGREITCENVFSEITDIVGIRVIHLHLAQFPLIHQCIRKQVDSGDWVLFEDPRAYTWDPESRVFFEKLGLSVLVKESFYTSIHYVVKPRKDHIAACEIQVRTLFEEIWGEIDHAINYPARTTNISCRDQIRVLARLVGAGSRLADSIFRTHQEKPAIAAESPKAAFDNPSADPA